MNNHRLALNGLHQVRVDRIHHPGSHGSGHIKVGCGDRAVLPVIRHHHPANTLTHVFQVFGDGENGHDLRADRDVEAGLHGHAVRCAAKAHGDVAQRLGAVVHDPAELDLLWVDVEATQATFGQLLVGVVALMLHPRGQGNHA